MNQLIKFLGTAIEVFAVIMFFAAVVAVIGFLGWGTFLLSAYLWVHVHWLVSTAVTIILVAFYIAIGVALFEQFV